MFYKGLLLLLGVSSLNCAKLKATDVCVGKPDETLLPHPDDCGKYYMCATGIAYEMVCPGDLYFNPKDDRCDFPSNVDCKNPDEEDEKVECPPTGVVFVPSKIRCDWYYICMQGVPSQMKCADGLHFSETESRCESIETANCQIGMTSTTVKPTTTPSTTARPTTTSSTPPINEFDKYCNPDELYTIPHPYKCNNFILCFNGTAVERWCAEDLHYSAKHQTCLSPREAQCISDGTICPEINDVNDIILLENIYDCNSFYICFSGSPIRIQCAPGQHWSQEKETCVREENSSCQAIEYPFPELNIIHATCHATGTYLVQQPTGEATFVMCDNGSPSILNFSAGLN